MPPKDKVIPQDTEGFYDEALTQAERLRFPKARKLEGIDDEIALLRIRLLELLKKQPQDTELLIKGIGLLVKAVAIRYKLSKRAEKDLYESVVGVVEKFGTLLHPEGEGGE